MATLTGARIVAEEHFSLTFSGPAVEGGRMSVRDLAPSLLALADAVGEASTLIMPSEPMPRLEISATAEGSFVVDMLISDWPGMLDRLIDVVNGPKGDAAERLTVFTGAVWGAFQVLRSTARRRIRRQVNLDNGVARLTLEDGTTLEVPIQSMALTRDFTFRQQARRVVAPLEQDGVDTMTIEHRERTWTISSAEVRGFDVPPTVDEQLTDNVREVALSPLNVAFVEGNKWRVSDGEQSFFTTVEDQDFLSRVATNQERFARSDILRVRLRTRQFRTDDGLRTDHVIERVLSHVAGPRQVPLPFAEGEATAEAAAPPAAESRTMAGGEMDEA